MRDSFILFNRPYVTGRELAYVEEAIESGSLSGNGSFTARCAHWLETRTGAHRAFLTHSCTAALELAALAAEVGSGDEVVMPSFTFVSTANAFVLRGACPVFVDVEPETLTLDVAAVEAALTEKTRVIVAVDYAGVGCDPAVQDLAESYGLMLVEDAAQGICASRAGRPLGSFGSLASLSFHETKNVMCGEGGALLVNDPEFVDFIEIAQEKGTNRRRFFRGEVDRYTWIDRGSSFAPSEIEAAFLWAQLEEADQITAHRAAIWSRYHESLAQLEDEGLVRLPRVPPDATHNAHMFYLLARTFKDRERLIGDLATNGVHAVSHYVPLHSSPAGRRFGRTSGALPVTDAAGARLLRLPLWPGMSEDDVEHVIGSVSRAVRAGEAAVSD